MNVSVWFLIAALTAQCLTAIQVPNFSFEEVKGGQPLHWCSHKPQEGGSSAHASHGKRSLVFHCDGKGNNTWTSSIITFRPGQVYRFSYDRKALPDSTGAISTGPNFANVDTAFHHQDWKRQSEIIMAPHDLPNGQGTIHFGNWYAKGTFFFDHVTIVPVHPIYLSDQGITLGRGEKININEYTFNLEMGTEGRNHSRPLFLNKAGFNTDRWTFNQGRELIYRHDLGPRQQLEATLTASIGYYVSGQLDISVSKDAKKWTPLTTLSNRGTATAKLPPNLFPAQTIYVRFYARIKPDLTKPKTHSSYRVAAFQMPHYTYKATLTGPPTALTGSTAYVEVDNRLPNLDINLVAIDDCLPQRKNFLTLRLTNTGMEPLPLVPSSKAFQTKTDKPKKEVVLQGVPFTLAPKSSQILKLPFTVNDTGNWTITASLCPQASLTFEAKVPWYLNASYGNLLEKSDGTATIWTASSGWKINRHRTVPTSQTSALKVAMASNEAEATQLVITPEKKLSCIRFLRSELRDAQGHALPASTVEILNVFYHDVKTKTDATGLVGLWPDALPPIEGPLDLDPQLNHPFWVRVSIPKETPAGTYVGTITIKDGHGWEKVLKLEAEVFDFQLPDRMTCQTAFGLAPWTIWRYHQVDRGTQRRELYHKYLKAMARQHLSPYHPAALDPFSVTLTCKNPTFKQWTGRFSRVTDDKAEGQGSILLIDPSPRENTVLSGATQIPLPQAPITLSLQVKTDQTNTPQLFLHFYDQKHHPIKQTCTPITLPNAHSWTSFIQTLTPPANAAFMTLKFTPVTWTDQGENTGKAWLDDLKVTNTSSNSLIFQDSFDPIPLQDYQISIDWNNWDKAMQHAFDTYHFNAFSLPVMGMGGGSFDQRREPYFFNFHDSTKEYKYLHPKYLNMLQEHLRQKGWLDRAYVYWFDEPAPRDYDFVMNGFRKLREAAPEIRRMLTEQVEPELCGGPNLWCPVSCNLDENTITPRQQQNETFWWYVCCAPKAPYATLFIDHPGTELRVWLWQTWQRNVKGILVWSVNYWTSPSAYPDPNRPQNPYLDPMGWSAGSSQAPQKVPWGNGDGRFFYPPMKAANANSQTPVLDGPVDSIRGELLRDGIEDYEYFVILKKLIGQNPRKLSQTTLAPFKELLKVPSTVSVSTTDFTFDPHPMEVHRLKLAQAIEQLK